MVDKIRQEICKKLLMICKCVCVCMCGCMCVDQFSKVEHGHGRFAECYTMLGTGTVICYYLINFEILPPESRGERGNE